MTVDMFRGEVPYVDKDTRITPARYWDVWNEEFRFTLDAAASTENAKCKRFFALADDGLSQSWKGERVWCNPPYSNIEPWLIKAWNANADLVVMLVPSWTDRKWWRDHVEPYRDDRTGSDSIRLRTRFIPQRIQFELPGGFLTPGRPEFASCLLIWKRQVERPDFLHCSIGSERCWQCADLRDEWKP